MWKETLKEEMLEHFERGTIQGSFIRKDEPRSVFLVFDADRW